MPDALFEDPRLVALYDALEGERLDLPPYVALVEELGARTVLDLGCGTGELAVRLARIGVAVTGVDPAAASLDVARTKREAESVRWIHGDARALAGLPAMDLVTITGNAAQAIIEPVDWTMTLRRVRDVLRPDGYLVFETRDPSRRAWTEWNRQESFLAVEVPGVGRVEHWVEVVDVQGPLVTFRGTYLFSSDATVLTSESTLRFRGAAEVFGDLEAAGLQVEDVREAPDRPGHEWVFLARRR